MLANFPKTYHSALDWGWADFEPFAEELLDTAITNENSAAWLAAQSQFLSMIHELHGRLAVAVDQDTSDQIAKKRLVHFREAVWSKTQHLTNQLEEKILKITHTVPDYDIQIQHLRTSLEIFHPDNVELEARAKSYRDQYEAIRRELKIDVMGQEHSIYDVLRMLHIEPDQTKREHIYRHILQARISVKNKFDSIWKELFALRQQIASNASMADYRAYMWKKLNRHDFTPRDVVVFCEAIEKIIVPITAELRQQQTAALGGETLKPWDKTVEVHNSQAIRPYEDVTDWLNKSGQVFAAIAPKFAEHFDTLQNEALLDLESRPNKSPWNYAESLPASNRSFIFINGRGGNSDIYMLFHEFGHAIHKIEMSGLPYMRQKMIPSEVSEVASTTMELLASQHLEIFYSPEDAQIVRHNHIVNMFTRWTFSAMVALFQHWAYTHPERGEDPDACDEFWLNLHDRFMPVIDYTGFEDDIRMQWREVFQIFVFPFYFIEYAFAQLGAVQIWQNYLQDPNQAIEQFQHALRRGHTVSVPEFYKLAGANFSIDSKILSAARDVMKKSLID